MPHSSQQTLRLTLPERRLALPEPPERRRTSAICILTACITLAGCATQIAPSAPVLIDGAPVTALAWAPELNSIALNGPAVTDQQWWQAYGDPNLPALIEKARAANPDLAILAENLVQADLQLQNAGASLLPGIGLSGSTGEQTRRPSSGDWRSSGNTSVSTSISYEVDLWGRLGAAEDAASFRRDASAFDFAAAQLSLSGAVASNWFQLLELRQRLNIARQNLELAEQTLRIVDVRYRNGVADRFELARQRTAVLVLRNVLPTLVFRLRQSEAALQVLGGEPPWMVDSGEPPWMVNNGELKGELQQIRIPGIDTGSPAELITRRPDLAAAEARLHAANANITQARAALLPAVSLSAALGLSSDGLLSLSSPLATANGLLALSQTLFDGGARSNNVALTESRQVALVQGYRSSLLTAFLEAGDAMARINLYREQEQRLTEIEQQAKETLRLSEVRYRQGAEDLITLLDSQRTLFDARVQRSETRLNHLLATVDLYKAVGGGF
ncbi:efflux transporter outer membrane subunit [Marinobacter sp. LV10MA510-1]|uniref:efflux transporter outer membrane subunit n=1 Tax=Marinobacter sp. LV10MA510-1 TaxID=1415567 RepID=UPI000BF5D2FE|nr:efflux transporter outer membrane subunit [Marinobacter sp. LV10MA510-1]PFG09010.1 NodT family efflux transporter outer membrane factor (OMF) lipoprotein [Marinobacter sp. LV10MA510-1]